MPFDDTPQSITPDPQTQGAPVANAPATPSSPSTPPAQPQQQVSNVLQQPRLNNTVQPSTAQPSADPNAVHPSVQKAGIIRSIAETLAGNPSTISIDPDGTRRVQRAPVTGKHLALAVAMEAISGSLTGLAAGRGRGPGTAGAAAFQQAQLQRQQAQQRDNDLAEKQFSDKASALAQKASSYAANLRTRAMAQEVGMRDEEFHKDWIAQHAPTVKYLREMSPGAIIRDNVPESEVTTVEFTREALKNGWVAIPVGYTPRFDSQGNHFSPEGTPLHNNTFLIADGRKISIAPEIVAKAQSWNLPGFAGWKDKPVNLDNIQLQIGTILDTSNKVASLELEQKDLNDYFGYLSSKGAKGPDGKPITAPDLKQLVHQNPALISYITGPWANVFSGSPNSALKAMKDGPARGTIANLYGGQQLLDKYDEAKALDKRVGEKTVDADIDVQKERALVPVHAANAKAEAQAKADVASASSHNEDGSWNPASIPVGLVEGTVDPTQLSKRGSTYNAQIEDANRYSLSKYGKPFDLAQAQSDYKFANNPGTQNTLRYLNSLTGADNRSGNLGSLVALSNKITRTSFPALNDAAGWARLQTGDPQMAAYYTAITETADQVAKILQGGGTGGGTSDAKLKQAAELFDKGFSRDQIVAVSDTLRSLLANRKTELIGTNRYLQKQFGGGQNPSTAQAPPASILKPGVNTTFANGQVWTLQNGQPVQVK